MDYLVIIEGVQVAVAILAAVMEVAAVIKLLFNLLFRLNHAAIVIAAVIFVNVRRSVVQMIKDAVTASVDVLIASVRITQLLLLEVVKIIQLVILALVVPIVVVAVAITAIPIRQPRQFKQRKQTDKCIDEEMGLSER